MRGFLAAARAASWLVLCVALPRVSGGQVWNDSTARALVERATMLRARQLADTGLTAYEAHAHGYVTFLGQLGREYFTPPKLLKADELELEVYWHAPNLSKQVILGRRDTLLLPTDIQYHTDHLGIVQNNFPNVIRIGEGDEVADVPHPLSPAGLVDYDFAMGDSLRIGYAGHTIRVYEVKVRPKDDRQPRVVGAVYIDAAEGQVVRMAFNFTRAAFLDHSLQDLSIVLENSLVAGRFWLPSHQEIAIRRSGTWMDTPVQGIIRGRWEISDYKIGTTVPVQAFAGSEIVGSPTLMQKSYVWTGQVLDSLPPDERAPTDADIARVQSEARDLVRAQALARVRRPMYAFDGVSDVVRVDRVEGLAIGAGVRQPLGLGISALVRARYGLDSKTVYGSASLAWERPSGAGVRLFATRDLRDVGDVAERSGIINSIAAQEFGSDDTDPYLVRGGGIGIDLPRFRGQFWQLNTSLERQDSARVNAVPVVGTYALTPWTYSRRVVRASLVGERATSLWLWGTELGARTELRGTWDLRAPIGQDWTFLPGATFFTDTQLPRFHTFRAMIDAHLERPFGDRGQQRLVTRTIAAGLWSSSAFPPQELVYFGGPVSGPGYDFHSLAGRAGLSEHVEWQSPIPFVPFSLGRFGRVPGSATIAPYAHVVVMGGRAYPAVGAALLSPFKLVRIDVARGLDRELGRWTFGVDVDQEFWSIL